MKKKVKPGKSVKKMFTVNNLFNEKTQKLKYEE